MQYDASRLLTELTKKVWITRSLLLLVAVSLTLVMDVGAAPQATRKRRVTPEKKPAAARRRVVKPKPLTAKDHRAAEQRLAELGYWTGRVDGRWDEASRHALIAFQKIEGLKPTGRLTRAGFERLMVAQRPQPREGGPAHVEVDLQRQVLFMVDDEGVVVKILPISSGTGKGFVSQGWARDAITPPGRFQIQGKIAGWKKSPMGRLYYPNYIIGGIAIHGYPSVPPKPASHGCIRIPMFAAREFSRLTPKGMHVIVHDGITPLPAPVLAPLKP